MEKAYDPKTADKDLSVPLRLDSDLEAKLSRATVAEVVKQMLEDIAHPEYLAEEVTNEYRISRGGGMPWQPEFILPSEISIMHSKVQIWHWSKIVHYWITIHIVLKIRKGHIPALTTTRQITGYLRNV